MKKHNNNRTKQENVAADVAYVYGRKPILDIVNSNPKKILKLFLRQGIKETTDLLTIKKSIALKSEQIKSLSALDFDNLFKDYNHQGIVAEIKPKELLGSKELIKFSLTEGKGIILVLDEINDPHNLGAILRVADAAGVDGVIVGKNRSTLITPTVRKVSAGASEFVNVAAVSNISQTILDLKKAGFWIIGTALEEKSEDIFEFKCQPPFAIVLGPEGSGLRQLTITNCDYLVKIPMSGSVQSLNVSNSAAIVLFEMLRKVRQ